MVNVFFVFLVAQLTAWGNITFSFQNYCTCQPTLFSHSAHILLFLFISICSFIISSLLSSCLLFRSPPRRAVVSLQPPQSSPHRESWTQSKLSPLSPGWVTSNPAPQAFLQACGPESWQLREAIVRERLTTHGSYCTKTHTHAHTS